jgi:hypothetical protein
MRATINPEERNGNQWILHSGGPNGLTHTPPTQEPRNIIKNTHKKPVRVASRRNISTSNALKTSAMIKADNNSNMNIAFPNKLLQPNYHLALSNFYTVLSQ